MASTISDFTLDAKRMHPDIGLAVAADSSWNWRRGNIYRRTITINNTGKGAKTNYITRLIFDSRTWHTDYKTTPTMNDVRIYDTDGITRLEHVIFAQNSTYTTIMILVPSIAAGATKLIYIEYGNPALPNVASYANVFPAVMSKSTKILECLSLDTYRWPNPPENLSLVHNWRNRANEFSTPINRNPFVANMPTLNTTADPSGMPVLAFTANKTLFTWGEHNLRTANTDGITFISYVYADVSLQRYQRTLSFQDGTGGFQVATWWNGGASQLQFILSNDGGTAGLNCGYVTGAWNLGVQRWARNQTNGMFTRRNGALVAQRNSNNVALPQPAEWNQFTVGTFNVTSEYFDGFYAAAMIFDEALTVAEIENVERALNSIYQYYGTDFPIVTLGSESTISGGNHTYTSYAPFSTFSISDKVDKIGTASKTQAKASIQTMLEKTLVQGIQPEGWSLSTAATDMQARQYTATTSSGVDSVSISRTEGVNINDLSVFYQDNLVGTDDYASTNNDYIEFNLIVENAANISGANSYIEFTSSGGTNAFRALLSSNLNTLYSNRVSRVKIRKSVFTVAAGSPTWSNVSNTMNIRIRTTSGSQVVRYWGFKLSKNYDDEVLIDEGSQAQLLTHVSGDNGATYFGIQNQYGVIANQLLESDNVQLSIEDYYTSVSRKTFSELDSFPSLSYQFFTTSPAFAADYTGCYTRALTHILSLVIPSVYLDIDLNMKAGDHQISGVNAYNGCIAQILAIRGTDTIGDVVNKILTACAGVMSFDTVSGKIIARNGYKIWDTSASVLPAPYSIQRILPPYKSDSSESDDRYNYIETTALIQRLNRALSYNPFAPAIGMYGDFTLIRPTTASERVTLFFEAKVLGTVDAVFHPQLYVDGWQVSDSQTAVSGTNAGVNIRDARIIGDKLALSFTNTSGGNRYLVAFGVGADYTAFDYITNWSGVGRTQFIANAQNASDISRNGRRRLEIDDKYAFCKFNNGAGDPLQLPELYTDVVTQLNTAVYDIFDVDYDPNLRVGQYVSYEDKSGRESRGYIVSLESYIDPDNYTQSVKVRRV